MSTLFSRDMKELGVTDDASLRTRPSLEVDTGTPTTATTAVSPLSPDFPSARGLGYASARSSDEKAGVGLVAIADGSADGGADQAAVIQALHEQILSTRRAWQRQIWELEGQVRDLKAEVEELRAADARSEYCAACGRGAIGRAPSMDDRGGSGSGSGSGSGGFPSPRTPDDARRSGARAGGVVNRPRARTGTGNGSRFAA